ncbi:EmrB/QacA subfamily drug resistance transporter [Pseudomonas sp. GV071]|nr:EmrB/QacA subfamily drug resistance transporter [Pseudomonas sp. GV071]
MTAASPSAPLSPTQLRQILFGLMLGIFLSALDQTIVAVALPEIALQLPGSELLAWVVSAYMLAMTIATPFFGKLGDLFGRRRLLLISTSLFVFASVLCALAQDMGQLVGARALQGIGAGGMIATIQALIGDLIAPAERGRYQAWFSGMFALASLIGPPLGGLLSQQLSWRWVFWINLPVGLLAIWLSQRRLAGLAEKRRKARLDYLGGVLLLIGLGSLLLLITRLGQERQWLSLENAIGLGVALLGLLLFVLQERRASEPVIPMELFRIGPVRAGWGLLFFANFQAVALAVLFPLHAHAQGGAGTGASQLMAIAIGAPLGAFIGGRLSSQLGRYKPLILSGNLLLPVALVALAFLPPSLEMLSLPLLACCGVALGLQFPTSMVAVQSAAPLSHLGVVTAACGMFRGLGGALGVTLLSSLLWHLLPSVDPEHISASLGQVDSEQLRMAFRDLLLLDAAIAAIPLLIALFMADNRLRHHLPASPTAE